MYVISFIVYVHIYILIYNVSRHNYIYKVKIMFEIQWETLKSEKFATFIPKEVINKTITRISTSGRTALQFKSEQNSSNSKAQNSLKHGTLFINLVSTEVTWFSYRTRI